MIPPFTAVCIALLPMRKNCWFKAYNARKCIVCSRFNNLRKNSRCHYPENALLLSLLYANHIPISSIWRTHVLGKYHSPIMHFCIAFSSVSQLGQHPASCNTFCNSHIHFSDLHASRNISQFSFECYICTQL